MWVADASGADSTRVESIRVVRVWYIHRTPDDDGLSGVGVGTDPTDGGGCVRARQRHASRRSPERVLDEDGNNGEKEGARGHGGGQK